MPFSKIAGAAALAHLLFLASPTEAKPLAPGIFLQAIP